MKKILLIFLIMIISVCAFSNVSAADASDTRRNNDRRAN